MTSLFDEKTRENLLRLKELFPTVDESSLFEVLLSCEGSLKSSEALLAESFPNYELKGHELSAERSKQSNIRALFGANDDGEVISKTSNHYKPVHLHTKQDVEKTLSYCSIHFNFLPKDLADSLLTFIKDDEAGFIRPEFYLFGNNCVSNHVNKTYSAETGDTFFYNGTSRELKHRYNDDLAKASNLIEEQVNLEIERRPKLPFQQKEKWRANIALCNKYYNKSNDLHWHSDRMTYLGPNCPIASMSLGACREFRVRKQYRNDENQPSTIYAIPLPHNTLIIMHGGFQEEYKHAVLSNTEFQPHRISGPMRINLTYRHYLEHYRANIPMCPKCGHQMDLRRSFNKPEIRGRYIWTCAAGYLNQECDGFFWASFDEENLVTDNIEKCSIWVSKDDHAALAAFRKRMIDKLEIKKGLIRGSS